MSNENTRIPLGHSMVASRPSVVSGLFILVSVCLVPGFRGGRAQAAFGDKRRSFPAVPRTASKSREIQRGGAGRTLLVPDDPAMDHLLSKAVEGKERQPLPGQWMAPKRRGPGFFLGYRLAAFDCVVRPCWYHQVTLMLYPISLADPETVTGRVVRLGLGLEAGTETSQETMKWWQHHQHLGAVVSLGVQYPWRIMPFIDFVVTLGGVHRNLYNKDFFDFAYSLGFDFGGSVFVVGAFHVTGSIGWRRWVLRSDMAHVFYDSLSITAGLGF